MPEPQNQHHELDVDGVDLEILRHQLKARFINGKPAGYVPGKTEIREAVAELLDCSDLEAENLVDTLESRNLIQYQGTTRGIDDLEHVWSFDRGD